MPSGTVSVSPKPSCSTSRLFSFVHESTVQTVAGVWDWELLTAVDEVCVEHSNGSESSIDGSVSEIRDVNEGSFSTEPFRQLSSHHVPSPRA